MLNDPIIIARLEKLSIPEPMSGCVLWLGSIKTNAGGLEYGRYSTGNRDTRKTHAAHRIAYRVFRGPIPEGLNVCHSCDVSLCINPNHLFVGTQQQNMDDAVRKGRMSRLGRGGSKRIPKLNIPKICKPRGRTHFWVGEDWPTSKLSNADAEIIRQSKDTSPILAERFGLSASYVRQIKSGTARKHG